MSTELEPDIQAFFDDIDERQFNCDVQNELTLYRATRDARFFWKAIMLFHEAGKALPAEFLAKLADWGGRVQQLTSPRELATALELSGDVRRRIGPEHSEKFQRRWRLASEVRSVLSLRPSLNLTQAIAIVARNRGVTTAKVKADYHDVFTAPIGKQKKRMAQSLESIDEAPALAAVLRGWKAL